MPFKLGPLEIGLILVIILVVFGVGKLPQVGAAIGKSIRAFKEGQTGEEEDEKKPRRKVKKAVKKAPATAASSAASAAPASAEKIAPAEALGTPSNN
jgi:sec-independent protein translocase protein TatA